MSKKTEKSKIEYRDVTHETFFKNRDLIFDNTQDYIDFINPDYEKGIIDPFIFVDMLKAVARIKKAIEGKEKILIYTDYDCDGIPAATILYDFFTKLNENLKDKVSFTNYIPHRHKEGYGLHENVLDKFIKDGYTLMITADLGITNTKEVLYAEENGMNVILTDHHLPIHILREGLEEEDIPQAYAVLNCRLKRESYPNKGLCGAGTAWKLVYAFLLKYGDEYNIQKGWEKWMLDMVALATVADMMSLTGENRVLVYYGMKVFRKSKREGLQKLLSLAKDNAKNIDEKTISFTIAPRVNAASRLDHPIKAFHMLTNFNSMGMQMAEELDIINTKRKGSVNDISNYLKRIIGSINNDKIIFVGDKDWPIGVVGLIAQKLVEMTGKTSFVYGVDEQGILRGSSRSHSKELSVMDIATGAREYLLHFGGHEAAGGFSFVIDNVDKLKHKLIEVYNNLEDIKNISDTDNKNSNANELEYIHDYDYNFENELATIYNKFQNLSPFGIGNKAPIIRIKGEGRVSNFGDGGKHLEINIIKDGRTICRIVKWNATQESKLKAENSKVYYANLEKYNWAGKEGYRFMLL